MNGLSAYEQERQRTIARNHAQLQSLGLEPVQRVQRVEPRQRKRVERPSAPQPVRKSPRGTAAAATSAAPAVAGAHASSAASHTHWEEPLLAEAEASAPPGAPCWDARRMHQHLTLSDGAHAVATTGVAGYGAALARKPATADGKQPQRWEVRAMRFGVGGFAVGVVRANMRPPFKSIGRSEAAVASYNCSGELSRFGGEAKPFGPAFSQGDTIGVALGAVSRKGKAATRELQFVLNGTPAGRALEVAASVELVLAVQPYMGGVALRTA